MRDGVFCKTCRYDLRGIDSGRCPECGSAFDPRYASTFAATPGDQFPTEMWVVVGMQCVNIALFLVGVIVMSLFDDMKSPYELLGVGMICTAMPLQVCTAIYGLCIAMFQFDSVVGAKRFWLIVLMTLPSFIVAIWLIRAEM